MSCEFCNGKLELIVVSTDYGKNVCYDCLSEVKRTLRCANCGITDFETKLTPIKTNALCPNCLSEITGRQITGEFYPIQEASGNITIPTNVGDQNLRDVGEKINNLFCDNSPSIFVRLLIYQVLKSLRRREKDQFYTDYLKFKDNEIISILTETVQSFVDKGLDASEYKKFLPADEKWLNESKNTLLDFFNILATENKWSVDEEFLKPPASKIEYIMRNIYDSRVDKDKKDITKFSNIIYITKEVLPLWNEFETEFINNNKSPEMVKILVIYAYPYKDLNLSFLSLFPNLEELTINCHDIESITFSDLKLIKNLKDLVIANCNLLDPFTLDEIGECKNLEELNCFQLHNNIYRTVFKKKLFIKIPQRVQKDDFILDLEPMRKCKKLKRIGLTSMGYAKINLEALSDCPELEIIDFSYNPAKKIDLSPLANCSKLKRISLSDIGLTEIDLSPLKEIKNPLYLGLDKNKITNINLHQLSDWPYLSDLFLRENPIETIDLSPLRNNKHLSWLILSRTGLKEIDLSPLADCTTIKKLELWGNNIDRLDLSPLTKWENLEILSLNSNKLQELDLSPLDSCKKLKKISAKFNPLQKIELASFKNRPSVKVEYKLVEQ